MHVGTMFLGGYLYLADIGTSSAGTITPGTAMAFYLFSGQLTRLDQHRANTAGPRGSAWFNLRVGAVVTVPESVRSDGTRLPHQGRGDIS